MLETIWVILLHIIFWTVSIALWTILALILIIIWFLSYDVIIEWYIKKKYLQKAKDRIFFIYWKDKKSYLEAEIIPHLNTEIFICNMRIKDNIKNFHWFSRRFLEYIHKQSEQNTNWKQSPFISVIKNREINSLSIRPDIFNEKTREKPELIIKRIDKFCGF